MANATQLSRRAELSTFASNFLQLTKLNKLSQFNIAACACQLSNIQYMQFAIKIFSLIL